MRSHPYSGVRRNPAPKPMADLVDLAKKYKSALDDYDNMTGYKKTKQQIKRKVKGRPVNITKQ